MKIGIVGSSRLSENEERDVRQTIMYILKGFTDKIIIVSGGANGVDKIAIEMAKEQRLASIEIKPKKNNWAGFKARNIQIAKICDEIFCITTPTKTQKCYHHNPPQDHEKTAGCYTIRQAVLRNKPVKLFVTPKRE